MNGARFWLLRWTLAMALATGLGLPVVGLLSLHFTARLWDGLRLGSPHLMLVAAVAGGVFGGALVGLVQWLFLRRRGVLPSWIALAAAGGLLIGLGAFALFHAHGTELVAAVWLVCGAVGLAQSRLCGARTWPLAQATAGACVALAFMISLSPGISLAVGALLMLAAGALTGLALRGLRPALLR